MNFIDLFDWEVESDRQYLRLLEIEPHEIEERLPAKILIKIKPNKNANQVNKRTFHRANKKEL